MRASGPIFSGAVMIANRSALPQALKSGSRRLGRCADPVIGDLDLHLAPAAAHSDLAACRAAVPDDVGHALAHCPSQYGINSGCKLIRCALNDAIDAGRLQQLACPLQFAAQRRLAVAGHSFAHLAQRPPGLLFYRADFPRGPGWILI